MKDMIQKIRWIFLPFILWSVGFVVVYTFLHWLLILKLELFDINESIIDIWLPFILPWIPILIFLRKRIKLLRLVTKRGDLPGLYMFIAGFAIAIPMIIAQGYIRTATGELSSVASSMDINKSHTTKYYQFKEMYLDRRFTGVYWFVEVTGKHNEYLNFHGFFSLPIMAEPKDTMKRDFSTWYGIEYKLQISNRVDQPEKEKQFKEFQRSSIFEYNKENLYKLVYFDKIGANDKHKGLLAAIKTTNNYDRASNLLILLPVDEAFELRNGNKFAWIWGSIGIAAIIWLIMVIAPDFDAEVKKKFTTGSASTVKELKEDVKQTKEFLQFMIPKEGFFSTPILIELNVLVYIIMVFAGLGFISFTGKDLLHWGADYRPFVTNGEYWRLFTNIFLHGGLIHLFMNMLGLVFIGIFLEPLLGSRRFLIFYIITGIIASLASIWWHTATVSVGASGAIFGMYGIFLALLTTKLFPKDFQKSFLLSTALFVGYNLLYGLTGGIDNAAHIGGLASGMIIGFLIYPALNQEKEDEKFFQSSNHTS
jgi:rhomboid protease GluP